MTAWPDKPFIRIIRGTKYGEPIHGSLALREEPDGRYLLVSGPRSKNTGDPVCTRTDSIDEWEEVVPVPAADLKRLRNEFRGSTLSERRRDALLQVTSCLTFEVSSAPDQAFSKMEESLSEPRHLPELYRLDVDYIGGQPVGTVEKIVRDEPSPGRIGPCIRCALRERFTVKLRGFGDGDCEELEC